MPATRVKDHELLQERLLGLMAEDHLRSCPEARVEAFAAVRPPQTDRDGRVLQPAGDVTVVRCIECGGSRVVDTPYDQVTTLVAEED